MNYKKVINRGMLILIGVTFTSCSSEASLLAADNEIESMVNEIFSQNQNTIEISNIENEEILSYLIEYDQNNDGKVTREEVYYAIKMDNTPIEFTIEDTTAYMSGVITSALPNKVKQLLRDHPEVTTIEMITVPGSINDEANLEASLYIHEAGLTTKLNSTSSVASGGTDFFLAGKIRIIEEGAKIGVHSWSGGDVAATEFPMDSEVHEPYLDFYDTVGVPLEFYWYTLEAAPAEGIHIMTAEEIEKYKMCKR